MSSAVTRLSSIEIKNFKNVVFGHIDFENAENYENASVLGLYGPNGSGKSILIDALELLRFALAGLSVSSYFADDVNLDTQNAELKYEFKILNPQDDSVYTVSYKVSLGRILNPITNILGLDDTYNPVLFHELLACSYECGNTKVRLSSIIDTNTNKDEVFAPKHNYLSMVGKDEDTLRTLISVKESTFTFSYSFIFSEKFLDVVRAKDNVTENLASGLPQNYHKFILESLVFFGKFQLLVVKAGALNHLNKLPLALYYDKEEAHRVGNITLDLNGITVITKQEVINLIQNKIDCMNVVLEQLIPRLSLSVKTLGTTLLRHGAKGYKIQFMANKNSKEIPLQYESEGIKKLISVLHPLIVAYNDPSITVAIDDLDYGVFEYLLGELLRIFSEKGCGQLIFTAHNLRPLETINKRFIAFTTTNPQNRYIRISHSRTLNNLRDFYYRDIILGEQKESVYEPTNNSQIALAFMEAGSQNRS